MESSHILIELRNSLGVCSCTHRHGEEKVNQNIEVKTSTIFLVMRVFFNEYIILQSQFMYRFIEKTGTGEAGTSEPAFNAKAKHSDTTWWDHFHAIRRNV